MNMPRKGWTRSHPALVALLAGLAVLVNLLAPAGLAGYTVRSLAFAWLLAAVLWSVNQWRRLWWVVPATAVASGALVQSYASGALSALEAAVVIAVIAVPLTWVIRRVMRAGRPGDVKPGSQGHASP